MNQESYDSLIVLSPSARVELAWWLKDTHSASGSPVHLPSPDMMMGCSVSVPSDQWHVVTKRFSPTLQLSRAKGVLFWL